MPESLTHLTVTGGYNNDETLKTGAFYDCRYLTDVVIGDGVTVMRNGIFYDNFALTNLTVPFAGKAKKHIPTVICIRLIGYLLFLLLILLATRLSGIICIV